MEELISSYLLRNKKCPLPGVGSLAVANKRATYEQSELQMLPPFPVITFSPEEKPYTDFVSFISHVRNISTAEAEQLLINYCNSLQNPDAYTEKEIPFTGRFYADAEGNLVFRSIQLPEAFMPPVHAERVKHPEATHTILVGDKESNSAIMTEYYNEPVETSRKRWWIGALVLFLVATVTILLFFFSGHNNGNAGNSVNVPTSVPSETYSTQK
jgi:hypothetical protein